MDEFTPHGAYTISNAGGYLIEISPCGEMARMLDSYGSDNPKLSEWKEIEYVNDPDDPEADLIAVIDPEGYNIPLNQVIKINNGN